MNMTSGVVWVLVTLGINTFIEVFFFMIWFMILYVIGWGCALLFNAIGKLMFR